jgi:hypothetical protein
MSQRPIFQERSVYDESEAMGELEGKDARHRNKIIEDKMIYIGHGDEEMVKAALRTFGIVTP